MAGQTKTTDAIQFKTPSVEKWSTLQEGDDGESARARDKLKETLLASLQMQHTVVLAGAGTSLGVAGGPSMQDLWDGAIGKTPNAQSIAVAKAINFNLSLHNIEMFLSKAEAYLEVTDDKAVKLSVDTCKKVILEKCSSFVVADKLEAHCVFLHRLSRRRVRDPRLKVFTTNYDVCFESAASILGAVIIDGFSFTPPRHYDPRYFSYDIIRRPRTGEDYGQYLEGVFQLYKLHGSVNWARAANGSIQEKANPTPDEACLIYPARGKYQQSFLQPHLESMSQYLAALREPNTCVVVVGFGFNDDHLSGPILAAVRSNPNLRVVVANPEAKARFTEQKESNKYWQDLFSLSNDGEDVWFINSTFEQLVKLIPDLKSLTPADRLMNAIRDVAGQP